MAHVTDVILPTDQTEGTTNVVGKWFKAVGDPVALNEPLLEIITDKVTVEIPAPAAGTLVETAAERPGAARFARLAPTAAPVPLAQVETHEQERIATGIGELDRVLGGGLVAGQVVLIGGDPGILARDTGGLPAVKFMAILGLGFVLPLPAFLAARQLGRLSRADSAALAAHYGSVSVGTLAVVIAYLATRDIAYEARAPVWVVMMEVPAILVGILLARGFSGEVAWRRLARELLLGRSIVLLLGGLAIGWLSGPEGTAAIQPLFFGLFKGISRWSCSRWA